MENEDRQEIAPNITLHWVHDHQIAYFTIRTVARKSWEAWQQTMMDLKREWPADRPFLTLQDNDFDAVASTPTVREYANQVGRFRPEVAQFSAIILPKNFVARFVQSSVSTIRDPNVEARVFFGVEEGLDWLKSQL